MDDRSFDMTEVPLRLSLEVAFGDRKVVAWAVMPVRDREAAESTSTVTERLVLFEASTDGKTTMLPGPLDVDGVLPLVESWLASVKAEAPQSRHMDGSYRRAWRVYNEGAGRRIGGCWSALAAIEPVLIYVGK